MTSITQRIAAIVLILWLPAGTVTGAEPAWKQPWQGLSQYREQAPEAGTYRLITEVDRAGGVGGSQVKGQVSRYYYRNAEGSDIAAIFAHYKTALLDGGMRLLFECIDEACGPEELSARWFRVSGIEARSGSSCRYLSGQIDNAQGTVFVALMVGTEKTQLDIIEAATTVADE